MRQVLAFVMLASIVVPLNACGPSEIDFTPHTTVQSPGGTLEAAIEVAHSKLAFGPATVRIRSRAIGVEEWRTIMTTKLANDGGAIHEQNITSGWRGDETLILCLSGAEQADTQIKVNLVSAVSSEARTQCNKSKP